MMKTIPKLQTAGFDVSTDGAGHIAWSANSEVYRRSARFKAFQKDCVNYSEKSLPPAICLVLFDCVRPSHILEIVKQAAHPECTANGLHIEWRDAETNRLERRLLSSFSERNWHKIHPTLHGPLVHYYPALIQNNVDDLSKYVAQNQHYKKFKEPLVELELDLLSCLYFILPAQLFAHCSGLFPFAAVPLSALARRDLYLPAKKIHDPIYEECDQGATAELIDSSLTSPGDDKHSGVIDLATDIFSRRVSNVDALNRREWARELHRLANQSHRAGPIVTLILAYGAHLCEAGTLQENNPADSTVKSYFCISAQRIYALLTALPNGLESILSANEIWDTYDTVVKQQSRGNQGTMRAALTNFHNFLVEWFDVNPLYRPLEVDNKAEHFNAQVVWSHEVELAARWAESHPDPHVGFPAKIMLYVAAEVPVRADEIMRLRICHIHFYDDDRGLFVEIEIANDAHSGRLKTARSQRVVTIRETRCIGLLRDWVERRLNQGSPQSGYLFGDPTNDGLRYKPAAIHAWISKLLKAATGQPDARYHWLRHTVLSQHTDQTLRSVAWIDSNRFEVIAAEAGHSSPTTTIRVYSHIYEQALRLWLNIDLLESVEFKSSASARFLGLSEVALRARASRAGMSASNWAWNQIFQTRHSAIYCERLRLLTESSHASFPAHNSSPTRRLTPSVVMGIIEDVACGISLETVSHRYALPLPTLEQWTQNVINALWQISIDLFPRRTKKIEMPESIAKAFEAMEVDFSRARQSKFDAFLRGLDAVDNVEAIALGVASWKTSKYRNLISLSEPMGIFALLNLMKLCAANPDRLTVCLQATNEKLSLASQPYFKNVDNQSIAVERERIRKEVGSVFLSVFNRQPSTKEVKFHPDRPTAYLQWNSRVDGGASGGSTDGLDAIMIGLEGYLLLKELTA